MMDFVLDNSVAMRWLIGSKKVADQNYAESVLQTMIDTRSIVPNLWHLEAANVLLGVEKRGEATAGEIERFISQLENLPIHVDPHTSAQSFSRTLVLARAYKLSSYDAAYLELAVRESIPLATHDKALKKAARDAGIEIYLNHPRK
jgi:predicted nucleic acid-binding protein